MVETGSDWCALDGHATAWFGAPSLAEAAALAGRLVELSPPPALDVRATGVRVRLGSPVHAEAASTAARELGLTADPAVPQRLSVVLESPDPAAAAPFWQRALGYEPTPDGGLADPLGRDPELRVRRSAEPRPLRGRLHLDVVRPEASVARAGLGRGSGPYGVRHAGPDGAEVDLVPGGPLDGGPATADWHVVFGAVACYRTTSPAQQRALVAAAATLAADEGFPLLVDARPGLVVLDSGKDRWDADAHGLALSFADLAARLQTTARGLGAVADPGLPRFVQLFLDAADVAAVQAFWVAALGYVRDPRAGLTDLYDPRRLEPVLVFQELDASDTGRRRQRDRLHVQLAVPADLAEARAATAVAAGGRVLDARHGRWQVSDPEGNELVVVGGGKDLVRTG